MSKNHMKPGMPGDKAKDFKGSMKQLIYYNKPFMTMIIIALILSMASSILAIIGPDKLKEITNVITSGLMTGIDFISIILFFKFYI